MMLHVMHPQQGAALSGAATTQMAPAGRLSEGVQRKGPIKNSIKGPRGGACCRSAPCCGGACRERYINTVKYLVDLGFYVNIDFHSIDPDSSIHYFQARAAAPCCLGPTLLSMRLAWEDTAVYCCKTHAEPAFKIGFSKLCRVCAWAAWTLVPMSCCLALRSLVQPAAWSQDKGTAHPCINLQVVHCAGLHQQLDFVGGGRAGGRAGGQGAHCAGPDQRARRLPLHLVKALLGGHCQ